MAGPTKDELGKLVQAMADATDRLSLTSARQQTGISVVLANFIECLIAKNVLTSEDAFHFLSRAIGELEGNEGAEVQSLCAAQVLGLLMSRAPTQH